MDSPKINALLKSWQPVPSECLTSILSRGRNALDGSDCGVGKTWVAASVIAKLKLPTLVVAPKISRTDWQNVLGIMGESADFVGWEALRTGRTPYGHWDNTPPPGQKREEFFRCTTCQQIVDFEEYRPCHVHHLGIHCIETKKKPWHYGQFHFAPEIKLIVADEIHRAGAHDSLNADMILAAHRQRIPVLGLSATPAVSPMGMNAIGVLYGLHQGGSDFYRFLTRYGYRKDPVFKGWQWRVGKEKQNAVMTEINSKLFPTHGVRVRKEEIPGFPEAQVIPRLFDIDSPQEIDRLYNEMAEPLADLEKRKKTDVAPESAITKILRARQRIELLKVPILVELAEDDLEKGFSVALFVNFAQTITELRRRLKCPFVIDGTPEGVRRRTFNIAAFQNNTTRKIIVNAAAGGICVSLQDLQGDHPRSGIVSPSFSATEFLQVIGRLQRAGGKSKALYRVALAAKTIEVKTFKALNAKLDNLSSLLDADLNPLCAGY